MKTVIKNDLREAAEMALEALETLDCGDTYKTHNAASALRKALAHEALDSMVAENQRLGLYDDGPPVKTYSGGKPNYCTEPEREWVGLTEEEFFELLHFDGRFDKIETPLLANFIRAIQSKLKEKNT